jgi:hypothetical protein
MRLARLVRWAVILGVLGWLAYTAIGASWSYVTTQLVIDNAFHDASAQHRAAFSTGTQFAIETYLSSVRSAILYAAMHEGLAINENDIIVSANQAGLSATVRWSYPIISFHGAPVVVIPLSVHRSMVIP